MQLNLFVVVVHCMKFWIGIPGAIAILELGGGYGPVRGLVEFDALPAGSSQRTYRVRKSKKVWVLDSGFHTVLSGFFVSGTWILDSNRKRDSGFL